MWSSVKNPKPRTVVKIRRPYRCCSICTEVRTIDCNLLMKYNANGRISIDCKQNTVVMAEWYRRALAIQGTTNEDNSTGRIPLIVDEVRVWGWRSLRAACHHPAQWFDLARA